MAKRLTRVQKKDQALIDLINKMFEIAGHQVTYDDIKDRKDNWFQEWTMTMAQGDEWRAWGEKYLKKQLRLTAKNAELQMQWASLAWGLKYSDFNL
jgi:hypothetical protein